MRRLAGLECAAVADGRVRRNVAHLHHARLDRHGGLQVEHRRHRGIRTVAVQDNARAGHGAVHLLVALDRAAVRAVAQRQVEAVLRQTLAYAAEAVILHLGVFLARRHIRHREVRKDALAPEARLFRALENAANGLLALPRREADTSHAGVELVVHGDVAARADGRRRQQLGGLLVVDRRGDAVFRNSVHIRGVDVAEDNDRLFDAVFAQFDGLRHGRDREIRRAHALQTVCDRHSAVAVAVRLDHAQHGRLRGLADDAVVMFDGTEVDLRPGAMLVWLHFSSSPDFRRYPPFS